MIYLKRHGELKLRFQQPDNSWHEVTALLGPMISTREAFTHAAFASNNGMIYPCAWKLGTNTHRQHATVNSL